MTVLGKIRNSIAHRHGQVVLRSELAKFGGQSQLTAALSTLISHGELVRMAPGVFAKASTDCSARLEWTCDDYKATFQEAFDKLHIVVTFLSIEQSGEKYHCLVNTGETRCTMPLQLENYAVVYSGCTGRHNDDGQEVPADLDRLPKRKVGEYILSIAKRHHVSTSRGRLDDWAEAVTKAAGDSVQLDTIGQTLVALFKAGLVNGKQMARLMTNYVHEKRRLNGTSDKADQCRAPSANIEYS
nr:hypothetical protein [uncultured Duganella sp.]